VAVTNFNDRVHKTFSVVAAAAVVVVIVVGICFEHVIYLEDI